MPIKTHIVKVEEGNKIAIPKTLCDALGVTEGVPLKVRSDGSGYKFTVEVVPTYENAVMMQQMREQIDELRAKNKELEAKYNSK